VRPSLALRGLVTVCLVALGAATGQAGFAKIVDRIVATVNQDVLTQGDLNRLINEHIQLLRVYERRSPEEAKQIAESHASERLDDLIASTVLEQEAQRQEREKPELAINPRMLEEEIRQFRADQNLKDDAEFERSLAAQGYSKASFEREMRKSLRIKELLKRDVVPKIHVTDAEAVAHFAEHPGEYETKDAALDALRETRFAAEREKYIVALRAKAFIKIHVTF